MHHTLVHPMMKTLSRQLYSHPPHCISLTWHGWYCALASCVACGGPTHGVSTAPNWQISDVPITGLARCPKGFLLASPGPHADDKSKTACLKPSIHLNYDMRLQDIKDGLPKFQGMPGSPLIPE
jgi:hypothetical protein